MKTPVEVPVSPRQGDDARCDLIKALDANSTFRRDSFWGGILHPGKVSYREVSATDSLHILIDRAGDVSAHVDDVSPLRRRPDGSCRYAWGRVLAHNLLVVIEDTARRLRGLHGVQRCTLHCDVEWYDDESKPAEA
jgi:hypothetical protein